MDSAKYHLSERYFELRDSVLMVDKLHSLGVVAETGRNVFQLEGKPEIQLLSLLNGSKIMGWAQRNLSFHARQKVWDRDVNKHGIAQCIWCKKWLRRHEFTLEHIIPLSKGGTWDLGNLGVACQPCNSSRENKH